MHLFRSMNLAVRRHQGLFVNLFVKFFAKFIHGTENFCNFATTLPAFVVHELLSDYVNIISSSQSFLTPFGFLTMENRLLEYRFSENITFMKKQVLFFIMLLLSVIAKADDSGQCGKNLTWTYVEATRTLTISGYGEMYNYNPNFAPWCKNYQNELETVIIEDGVTSIGHYAFDGCSGLTSIEIPNSVTSIGDHAFNGCSGLTSIEIPNSVTSIGDYAFYNCSGLTSIEIPNSVTSIGSSAFYGCSGLTSIEIPNSVTSIGNYAFRNCI